MEKRGHAFARYADDCNVYVQTKRSGERVMEALRRLYGRLRLKVNEAKSAVARPGSRKFLGYSFFIFRGEVRRRIARKALVEMQERVRQITRRNGGRSLESVIEELGGYLLGWKQYFQLAQTPSRFERIDEWIRHRLRVLQLRLWKNGRAICRELLDRGMDARHARMVAANRRSWWRNGANLVHRGLPNSHFAKLGLPSMAT